MVPAAGRDIIPGTLFEGTMKYKIEINPAVIKAALACTGFFSAKVTFLFNQIKTFFVFIGIVATALLTYSATLESYTLTFDHKPFVFSIQPTSRFEQELRYKDEIDELAAQKRKSKETFTANARSNN